MEDEKRSMHLDQLLGENEHKERLLVLKQELADLLQENAGGDVSKVKTTK